MRTPRAEARLAPFFVVLAVGATAIAIAAGERGTTTAVAPAAVAPGAAWRGLVGPRPPVAGGQRVIVVLRTASLAERVAVAGAAVDAAQEEAWTRSVSPGRGPSGEPLPPGRYVVTLVAYPVDGGAPSRRKVGFTLR